MFFFNRNTVTPPSSLPSESALSPSTLRRTGQATRLRSLSVRPVGLERPLVHVDPNIGKATGLCKKKLRTYLGVIARDKVDVTYIN